MKASAFLTTISSVLFACMLIWPGHLAASPSNAAEDLLKKAAQTYELSHGVAAAFSIRNTDANGQILSEIEGRIALQDARFVLEVTDEMKAWFDGRHLWTYLPDIQEVNLSEPTQEELLLMNPVNVFLLYQHGYNCTMLGERQKGQQSLCGVALRPQDPQAEISSIEVYFDKKTLQVSSISIRNANQSQSIIIITEYQPNQNYSEVFFLFPQKDYPKVEVIDLR